MTAPYHPDVLAAWEAYRADRRRFSGEVEALAAEMWPKPVPVAIVQTGDSFHPGAQTLVGWSWRYSLPVPEGWKRGDTAEGYMISPKISTKTGKAARKQMEKVVPVRALSLPGMPTTDLSHLPHLYAPGVEKHGDALYVTWPEVPGEPIDFAIWTQIKLSEYHAAREADPEYAEAVRSS